MIDELARRCQSEPALAHTSSLLMAVDGVEVAAYDLHGIGLDTPVPTLTTR